MFTFSLFDRKYSFKFGPKIKNCLFKVKHSSYWGIISLLLLSPYILKSPPAPPTHPPTLRTNWRSQVFLTDRSTTVTLSSINTIHVKQQCWFFYFQIFKFTPKYMLVNVYINKIHSRQCLYIISLYCRKVFLMLSISLLYRKESFTSNFQTARKKRFFYGATYD